MSFVTWTKRKESFYSTFERKQGVNNFLRTSTRETEKGIIYSAKGELSKSKQE